MKTKLAFLGLWMVLSVVPALAKTPVNEGRTPVNEGRTPVNEGRTPVNEG